MKEENETCFFLGFYKIYLFGVLIRWCQDGFFVAASMTD